MDDHYRRTSFWVEDPNVSVRLRIGEHNPLIDQLIARHAVDTWAFVTAYNPRSELISNAANESRQSELQTKVNELGFISLPGRGFGDQGSWPAEISIWIIGISNSDAVGLGREYEQNAIVVGKKDGVPELLWCL